MYVTTVPPNVKQYTVIPNVKPRFPNCPLAHPAAMALTARYLHLPLVAVSLVECTGLHPAHAEEGFGIEDDNLRPAPPAAMKAMRAHISKTEYKDCAQGRFVGSTVDLDGGGRKLDWIAKTADGCGWGASTAKIWILRHEKTRYRVVLDSGGQGVVLLNSKTNGLRDLEMPSGTAGRFSAALFKFDGVRYTVFRSCAVDLQGTLDASDGTAVDCKIRPISK